VSPHELICVYVDASRAARLERVKERDGLSAEQLAALERHSTEIEVEQRLKRAADFIANNANSTEECADTVVEWAKSRRLV
jgi:dephospho-CoA kinase